MNNEDLLIISNLNKSFDGQTVLKNINVNLKKGEKTALVGSDGSGKTTFLRLITGLLFPDGYKERDNIIKIEGFSPYKNRNEIKKIIGYMPQTFGLYEDLSVIENLELYLGLKNIKKDEAKETVDELLRFSGLFDFKERLAGDLSGGMKQKLGLSCTLLTKPKLLLLDEPSVGVDPISRRDLISITDKLAKENNIGIIWATSYLDEAQFFEKVILFEKGEKIFDGKPNDAKEEMKGLTFYTKKENTDNRIVLENIIENETGIKDATIEGDKVRVVFEDKKPIKNFKGELEPAKPIFEDFVMSKLSYGHKYTNGVTADIEINPPDNKAIEAIGLTKIYKSKKGDFTAANNIRFDVKKGEIFGLLGPNGAGKSTTFKMLCGLIKPSFGTSKIMGLNLDKNPIEAKRSFGYMAQKFSLFGNLSVKQNIEFFAGVYGLFGKEKKEAEDRIIDVFELENYLDCNAGDLPLGFKQRLALGCAIIHKPPVLFLDEPTSGVDPVSRREFWIRINNLAKHKTSVLVTTHFMDEAQFCDRISIVYKGKILVIDTPNNLKEKVKTKENKNPTMEDAFIQAIEKSEGK